MKEFTIVVNQKTADTIVSLRAKYLEREQLIEKIADLIQTKKLPIVLSQLVRYTLQAHKQQVVQQRRAVPIALHVVRPRRKLAKRADAPSALRRLRRRNRIPRRIRAGVRRIPAPRLRCRARGGARTPTGRARGRPRSEREVHSRRPSRSSR